MLGPEMNAGLDTGLIQKMCSAGSVPGPDFGEDLTSLVITLATNFLPEKIMKLWLLL